MKFKINNHEVELHKEINNLDNFVINFIEILKPIRYVIISGYEAIFFGRSRGTEDVDIFIEEIDYKTFRELFDKAISKGLWCVNGDTPETLFSLLTEGSSIRFAVKDEWVPNIEIKFAKDSTDLYSLNNPIIVKNGFELNFGPIELQIAYKLFLGSDKDIEDAKHLFKLFKKYLNDEEINYYITYLKINKDKLNDLK